MSPHVLQHKKFSSSLALLWNSRCCSTSISFHFPSIASTGLETLLAKIVL